MAERPWRPPPRIAVVDSGIGVHHPGVRGMVTVAAAFAVDDDGRVQQEPPGRDHLGHGTAVAATIGAHLRGAVLESLRVLDRTPHCSIAALCAALELCAGRDIAFVNISLGIAAADATPGLCARLLAAVQLLVARGCTVVAPVADALGRAALPGTLAGVDGVLADGNATAAPTCSERDGARVWHASPLPPPGIAGLPQARVQGASLAVAHVVGHLAALRAATH